MVIVENENKKCFFKLCLKVLRLLVCLKQNSKKLDQCKIKQTDRC